MTDKPLSAAAGPSTAAPSLAYMAPAWFAVVMGWSGLAGAWLRAEFLLGEEARALGTLGAVLAALVFMALGLASLRRLRAHPAAVRAALDRYGAALGLAFQVVDDILDVTADSATLGKTAGKDAANDKPTYVSLLGLDGSRALARSRMSRRSVRPVSMPKPSNATAMTAIALPSEPSSSASTHPVAATSTV